MNKSRDLCVLATYSAWANEQRFEVLRTLSPAQLVAPHSCNPGGILGVLGHIYTVDQIWQAHLEGRDHGLTSRHPIQPLSLSGWVVGQRKLDHWFIDFSQTQTDLFLNEEVDFRFVDGRHGTLTRRDMLFHVVNHKTYHRGYVATMLYQFGMQPPTMDLPVFFRVAPPKI